MFYSHEYLLTSLQAKKASTSLYVFLRRVNDSTFTKKKRRQEEKIFFQIEKQSKQTDVTERQIFFHFNINYQKQHTKIVFIFYFH
jgi:hypothetical protein